MANALKNRWKFPILLLFVFFRLKLRGNGLIRRKPLMIMKTRDHSSKKSWVWLLRSPNSSDRTFGFVVQSSFCCCKKRSIFLFSCFLIVWLQITDTTNKSQSPTSTFQLSWMPKIRCVGGSMVALCSRRHRCGFLGVNRDSRGNFPISWINNFPRIRATRHCRPIFSSVYTARRCHWFFMQVQLLLFFPHWFWLLHFYYRTKHVSRQYQMVDLYLAANR